MATAHLSDPPIEKQARRPARRRRRIAAIIAGSIAAILVAATGAFLVWANDTYAAEPAALAAVRDDARVEMRTIDGLLVLSPTAEPNGRGVVFLAGAKVEADAYAGTFQDLVAAGTTVVVVQPFLNFALLETRSFDEFTSPAPQVERWAVGGHSQGGVKACEYARDPAVSALVLLASYCSTADLSDRDNLAVLSVSGSRDPLVSDDDVRGGENLLPDAARFVRLEGVSHAQFGAYGVQAGDGTPTVDDDDARLGISAALDAWASDPSW